MLNLAGTKDARKMISKPRSVLTLTFILFLVMPAPSATERQEGSIGSMVAAEARERFSLWTEWVTVAVYKGSCGWTKVK